jgi:hypothetical protein
VPRQRPGRGGHRKHRGGGGGLRSRHEKQPRRGNVNKHKIFVEDCEVSSVGTQTDRI